MKSWGDTGPRSRNASRVFHHANQSNFQKTYSLVEDMTRRHEQYHFIVEYFTSIIERERQRDFYQSFCQRSSPYSYLEEAIANSYEWRRKMNKSIRSVIYTDLKNSPPGYRDFEQYTPNPYYGERQLADDILNQKAQALIPSRALLFPVSPNRLDDIIPEYSVTVK